MREFKKVSKLVAFLMAFAIIFSSTVNSVEGSSPRGWKLGRDYGPSLSAAKAAYPEYDPANPMTWSQTHAEGHKAPLGATGGNFGKESCAIHSVTAMFIRYGARERGKYVPIDYRDEALKINQSGGTGGITWAGGGLHWTGAASQSNGYFQFVGDVSVGGNAAKERVKQELEKKNAVIIQLSAGNRWGTHYVLIDGFEGDKTWIVDSSGKVDSKNKYVEDYDGGWSRVGRLIIYKPLKNEDAPFLHSGKSVSTGNLANEGINPKTGILSEDALTGMPKELPGLQAVQEEISILSEFQDGMEKLEFARVQEELSPIKEAKQKNWMSALFSVTGVFLILLAIVRQMVFMVDVVVGTKLFRYFNAKRKYATKGYSVDYNKRNSISLVKVLIQNGLILFVGLSLFDGLMSRFVLYVINLFS